MRSDTPTLPPARYETVAPRSGRATERSGDRVPSCRISCRRRGGGSDASQLGASAPCQLRFLGVVLGRRCHGCLVVDRDPCFKPADHGRSDQRYAADGRSGCREGLRSGSIGGRFCRLMAVEKVRLSADSPEGPSPVQRRGRREARLTGAMIDLFRMLATQRRKPVTIGVSHQALKWRRERDSNPRYRFRYTHFPGVRLQPLGHPSGACWGSTRALQAPGVGHVQQVAGL